MLLLEDKRFYVYIYLDPRKPGQYKHGKYEFYYEPFYVGLGHNKRHLSHLYDAKNPVSFLQSKHKKEFYKNKYRYEEVIC